jgi:hypothetical protein
MKKKRFAEGGYTDQEASDLMLNDILPKRSIRLTSDEPATAQSAADTAAENAAMAREMAREARAAAPRVAPRAAAPVATPSAAPRLVGRSLPEMEPLPEPEMEPRTKPAPSRGSYDMDGPIAGLLKMAAEPKGKVTPRPRMIPSADEGPRMTSRKPKPKPKSMSDSPYKTGGSVNASKRADGIAQRGKTKGRMI